MPTAKLCRTALAAVAALVLIPVSATDSSAATCSLNHFCLWGSDGYQGPMGSFVTGADDTGKAHLPNGGSSAHNRTKQDWCLWSGTEYRGNKTIVRPSAKLTLPFRVNSLLPENSWRCVT